METTLRLLLLLAATSAGPVLCAQENGPAAAVGQVLLLKTDRALEGDIEKIADQYRIRRGASEVWLPADKATRLCADWDDAFAYMKSCANLGDPDERLRLARWCQLNNLRAQALAEAKAAQDLRPNHQDTRKLVGILTRLLAAEPTTAGQRPSAQSANVASLPSPDISADAFAVFATRVQPILMNTCVSCHTNGRGGAFQLIRTEGGQRAPTQANLAATLAQVRTDHANISPLLVKAVSPHGNASNSPLKDRQSIPFRTLQAWIEYTLANNPHLKYVSANARNDSNSTAERPTSAPTTVEQVVSKTSPRMELVKGTRPAPSADSSETETTPAASLDPFDPAVFNRQMHPRK